MGVCDPTCLKGVALVERMRNRHQGTGRESGQPGRGCCDDIGADGLGLSWGSGGGGPSGQIPEYSAGRAGLELTAEREREESFTFTSELTTGTTYFGKGQDEEIGEEPAKKAIG